MDLSWPASFEIHPGQLGFPSPKHVPLHVTFQVCQPLAFRSTKRIFSAAKIMHNISTGSESSWEKQVKWPLGRFWVSGSTGKIG